LQSVVEVHHSAAFTPRDETAADPAPSAVEGGLLRMRFSLLKRRHLMARN
jgi:hypothetical protein